MLEIKNYTKIYKDYKAVDNLSLEVNAGDIFGFIGHNGAGKSTTIKSIVGILNFQEGDIFIDGHSIKKDPFFCKRLMAYLPDNPDLYVHLKGIEYLNFVCDLFDVKSGIREERIKRYSDLFEMTDHLGDLISSYSHGMRQKLAIVSAFIHEPKLLVLDEPFVGLDPKASHTLKVLMNELTKQGGAIFFSTHVLEVVEKLCNRVGIIKNGKLIAYGNLEDVKGDSSLESIFLEMTDK